MNKKVGGFHLKPIFRLLLTIGVIAFVASITAVSCGKTAGGGNNNNANNSANNSGSGNSGGNGGGGSGCTGICPTTNLILTPVSGSAPTWVRIGSNTITINATGLAGAITPHSDTDPDNRGFDDASTAASVQIFFISYPRSSGEEKAIMYFVNRASVSTNDITMPATTATCPSSETTENTRATAGSGTCRKYIANGTAVAFHNYLGTVFNNTDTVNRARGTMRCHVSLNSYDTAATIERIINDSVVFNYTPQTTCYIAVVNSAGTAAAAEIDDAWVGDSGSTAEVEFHAIGIDVSGKMLPQFSSETGYGLTRFTAAHDNAGFKRLLQNNPWGELKFKLKIVKSTDF